MKSEQLLRAILPDVLIDNFDIVNFDKSADRFDIYLDEKKVQLKEDKINPDIISYGFGEYRTIQDYPIRGRATYLHVRKFFQRVRLDAGFDSRILFHSLRFSAEILNLRTVL